VCRRSTHGKPVPDYTRVLVKRLYLLRHAKSSWGDPQVEDHERPLTTRGKKAADQIGSFLRRENLNPALVLCSSALRARQTLARVLPSLPSELAIQIEDGLYGASSDELLARIRDLPTEVPSAMLIGHNPGIEELARALVKTESAVDLAEGFPTAALAVVDFRGRSWGVRPAVGDLVSFVTPREL